MSNPTTSTPKAVSISLEFTPNPNTLKFVTSHFFLEKGAENFPEKSTGESSPLAKSLFGIPGIQGVLIGTNFLTVTKAPEGDWDVVAEEVPKRIEAFVQSGAAAVSEERLQARQVSASGNQSGVSEIERKIRDVLDEEIRPAVAMDGGDITFGKFEDGIVYLHLQGSCSSCPSSVATLKMGVESRLKDVIPEVREVVQI